MYRLPGNRLPLDLDGPTVEVEPLHSWMVQREFRALWDAYVAAEGGSAAEYGTLAALIDRFITEAQPSWDFADHLGPIPNTARGMTRLDQDSIGEIVSQWLATLNAVPEREELPFDVVESDAPTAADALLPPAAAKEVKRRLRAVKRAA